MGLLKIHIDVTNVRNKLKFFCDKMHNRNGFEAPTLLFGPDHVFWSRELELRHISFIVQLSHPSPFNPVFNSNPSTPGASDGPRPPH